MVSTAEEYFANLFKINGSFNPPSLAVILPRSENIYKIDLNSRTVEAPEYLSVLDDHNSETVYFIMDRFFDNMDMSTTTCVIQYVNALGEGRLYVVPFYDIETYHATNQMLIPWCIEGEATKAAGDVTYSIRFFQVDVTGKYITYNLNTIPSVSKILNGINVLDFVLVSPPPTREQYENSGVIYYTAVYDGKGNIIGYAPAEGEYNSTADYYTLAEGYKYSDQLIEEIIARIATLEHGVEGNGGFNIYWYEQ